MNNLLGQQSDLIYNIEGGRVWGRVGERLFDFYAGSGGRAGSKIKGAVNPRLANNPFATAVGGTRSEGTHHFGPIPQGTYYLREHEKRTNWIRLIPHEENVMHGRAGFALHGRGQVGSHGCLVPDKFGELLALLRLVRLREKASLPNISLKVIAMGMSLEKHLTTRVA